MKKITTDQMLQLEGGQCGPHRPLCPLDCVIFGFIGVVINFDPNDPNLFFSCI
jgi:hypothetical protein